MICKNKSNSKRKKDRIEVADSSLGSVDIHPIRLSRDDDSRFHSDMKTISVKNHSEDITVIRALELI